MQGDAFDNFDDFDDFDKENLTGLFAPFTHLLAPMTDMTDEPVSPFQSFFENPSKPVVTLKPRARLSESALAGVRAVNQAEPGQPLRLRLVDIDEDPDQPRTAFDVEELQGMADSIVAHGVVQPIVVRPSIKGRHVLVFGARRLRASRLAGVEDIPAVIRLTGADEFAVQLIENQQRANLSNSDLAVAIARLVQEGLMTNQIAVICSLKAYQVTAFRQAKDLPPELAKRMDTADMRALYDLSRQWSKTPEEVLAALPEVETFLSVTEARRIIASINGKPTGSIVIDRAQAAAAALQIAAELPAREEPKASLRVREPAMREPAAPAAHSTFSAPAAIPTIRPEPGPLPLPLPLPEKEPARVVARTPDHLVPDSDSSFLSFLQATHSRHEPAPEAASVDLNPIQTLFFETPTATAAATPIFIVSDDNGRVGRLVVDRRADQRGMALVAYPDGVEEVDISKLRIVSIE